MLRQAVQSPRGRSRFQELLGFFPFCEALEYRPSGPTQMRLWKRSNEAGKEVSFWGFKVRGQTGLQAQLGPHGGCKCW